MKMTRLTLAAQARRLARRTAPIATIAAAALTATGATAAQKPLWERQTDSAYLTVFAHHCTPGLLERAAVAVRPHSIEVAIYMDRFRVDYESDCGAFYLGEIATRIDPA
jgi:hypothetical protein